MTDTTAEIPLDVLDGLAQLLTRVAEELAFVEVDSDAGLLAINALLMDLEQLPGVEALPEPYESAQRIARAWIDSVLDGTGRFSAKVIADLLQWHEWLNEWLACTVAGVASEPLPADWQVIQAVTESAFGSQEPAPSDVLVADGPAAAAAPISAEPDVEVATILLNLPADIDLLREFYSESLELLQAIEQAVLTLEENPSAPEAVNAIFRAFHTFKGSAGFLKLNALQHLAHELETLLDAVRSGALGVSRRVIDAILIGADVLADCTRRVGEQVNSMQPVQPIPLPTAHVLALVQIAQRPEPIAPAAPAVPAIIPTHLEAPSALSAPSAAMNAPGTPTVDKAVPPAPAVAREGGVGATDSGTVRLDATKLDDLVNLVGELVVAQAIVAGSRDVRVHAGPEFAQAMNSLVRITKELQRNAMSLRMVPISGLFRKMTRLVRDLASREGKQVKLVLQGEDTELDRQLVDKMGDPLIHMIRNALDHGIELPADRVAAGKDPVGTIGLAACHEHGGVVIRVSDDGRGLDGERLQAKAVEKGLISPSLALSVAETLELIFLPGLSTAATVTDLSGRGVGMDVVRGHIEALRGTVEIESHRGRGTTFSIRLPLTLALIDGLLVGVGAERYVIPALAVRECFRPSKTTVTAVHEQGELVNVRGHQVPVLRLGRYLNKPMHSLQPEEGIMVVVESGGAVRAILVDEVHGKQEMIIKKLGHTFEQQILIVGGAVLADGTVGLILNVDLLVRAPRAVQV